MLLSLPTCQPSTLGGVRAEPGGRDGQAPHPEPAGQEVLAPHREPGGRDGLALHPEPGGQEVLAPHPEPGGQGSTGLALHRVVEGKPARTDSGHWATSATLSVRTW